MSVNRNRLSGKDICRRHDFEIDKDIAIDLHDALTIENENRRLNNEKEVSRNKLLNKFLRSALDAYFVFEGL